ncbi:MAG: O-antigen ligase family protein [Candidatus Dojkabacteria bacterium]
MTILSKNKFKKEFLFITIVLILFLALSPILLKESPQKTIVIFLSLLFWVGLFIYTKKLILSSLLYIFLVLPFNIALQLPLSVEIFNTEVLLAEPFVEGIYVNYLVPTLSIIDLGILLVLGNILLTKGFSFYKNLFKNIKNGLAPLLVFLLVQNVFLFNINSLLFSLRLFSLILLFLSMLQIMKEIKLDKRVKEKIFNSGAVILLTNVLIQGTLGAVQFKRGSGLGIDFLGESEIVGGMMGSSFVELSGQVFLRAYGTFPHPNVLAGFLLLGIFLGIYLYKRRKLMGSLLIGASFLFMVFTFSRVSILLALFVLLVFLLKEFLFRKKSLLSISFSPLLLLERFQNLFNSGDRSWSERLDLVKASFRIIKQNWLLGVGGGNFVEDMEGIVPRTSRGILLTQPVHNIFLLYISEFGILGFLLIFYVLFYAIIKNIKRISVYGSLILFVLIVIGLFDHYLFSLPQGLVIFFSFLSLLIYSLQGKVKV